MQGETALGSCQGLPVSGLIAGHSACGIPVPGSGFSGAEAPADEARWGFSGEIRAFSHAEGLLPLTGAGGRGCGRPVRVSAGRCGIFWGS